MEKVWNVLLKKGLFFSLLLLMLFTLSACGKSGVKSSEESTEAFTVDTKGPWDKNTKKETMTLMIYMVGSDLESGSGAATSDLEEIAGNKIDFKRVNVVVCTGGAPKWHNDFPADKNAIYQLTKNGYEQLEAYEQTSMGTAENFTRFLDYSYQNFPAENYGLILWDHGNGPLIGYGLDRLYDNDSLTLAEIGEGLKASPFKEDNKLSFIGFDACLMSSCELACTVADYADYMIASQEVEPNFGWNYDFLDRLGRVETDVLASKITNSFLAYSVDYYKQNPFFQSDVTLASMDLSYAKELQTAINDIFKKASEDVSGEYNDLAVERVRSRSLGRATTGSEYDLVDTNDLVSCMEETYPKECQAVKDVLEKMIVSNDNNTENVCGISIYYPYYNKNYYRESWKDTYTQLGLFPDYINYLSRYEKIWLGTNMKDYFDGKLVPEEGAEGEYSLRLTDDQKAIYANSGFYIMRRTGKQLYKPVFFSRNTSFEDGKITANFDGNIIYLKDISKKIIPLCIEKDTVGDMTYYTTYPKVTGKNFNDTKNTELQLALDRTTGDVQIKSFTEDVDDGRAISTGKKEMIDLQDWRSVEFYEITSAYLARDDKGNIKNFFDWETSGEYLGYMVSANDGFEFTYEPIYDDGYEYFLMFTVADLQNNSYSSELLPITLADKPEKAEEKPNKISMKSDGDGEITIYEDDKVTCSYILSKDYETGQTVQLLKLENRNDFEVDVELSDIVLNEKYSLVNGVRIDAAPGITTYRQLEEAEKICLDLGIDYPKTLSYHLKVIDDDAYKTILPATLYQIDFEDEIPIDYKWVPFHGCLIEDNQVLYEKDGIKLTLLKGGSFLGASNVGTSGEDAKLTLDFIAENTTDEQKEIEINGLYINGIYTNQWQNFYLEPKSRGSIFFQIELPDTMNLLAKILNVTSYQIDSLGVRARAGDAYMDVSDNEILSIRLSQSEEGTSLPESNIIYEDDYISVKPMGMVKEKSFLGKDEYNYLLALNNKTDRDLMLDDSQAFINGEEISEYTNEDYSYYSSFENSAANETSLLSFELSTYKEIKDLKIKIHGADMKSYEDKFNFDTDWIDLLAGGGKN